MAFRTYLGWLVGDQNDGGDRRHSKPPIRVQLRGRKPHVSFCMQGHGRPHYVVLDLTGAVAHLPMLKILVSRARPCALDPQWIILKIGGGVLADEGKRFNGVDHVSTVGSRSATDLVATGPWEDGVPAGDRIDGDGTERIHTS